MSVTAETGAPIAPSRWRGSIAGWRAALALYFLLLSSLVAAQDTNTLEKLSYAALPGGRTAVLLDFELTPSQPRIFTIDNPSRIVVDLLATKSSLTDNSFDVGIGSVRSINALEAGGRTRLVLDMITLEPVQTRIDQNRLILSIGQAVEPPVEEKESSEPLGLTEVDFRRGSGGQGLVLLEYSGPAPAVDVTSELGKLVVTLPGLAVPQRLVRRLDVVDFATPVTRIDTLSTPSGARIEISAVGDYDELTLQSQGRVTVELRPLTEDDPELRSAPAFTGERVSLNFQSIAVREALYTLIADFAGLNLVMSDDVSGDVTLSLKDVPWDQALDIILKTRNLGMRRTDNVVEIGALSKIAQREKNELLSQKEVAEVAPLVTELIPVNFASAGDLARLLNSDVAGILSERGQVIGDSRTNSLLIVETRERIAAVRRLLKKLDTPVKQVLVEARIVVARDDFSRAMGVRFGATGILQNDSDGVSVISGSSEATDSILSDIDSIPIPAGQTVAIPNLNDRLMVDLPAGGNGRLAIAALSSDFLIDLELTAAQQEGISEVVSSPRVVTSNGMNAKIEQGVDIPFKTVSDAGTKTEFKKASLSIDVTPQITPDDHVLLDLTISRSSPGTVFPDGVSIDTRQITTTVTVADGDTVVLGGIFEHDRNRTSNKVPLLGDIPLLGRLFRDSTRGSTKNELLIFVTPKILKNQDIRLSNRFR